MSDGPKEHDNASLQAEEIEALLSIYGEDWKVNNSDRSACSIEVGNDPAHRVHFEVTLPSSYPLESPPIYQFSAPWMSRQAKCTLANELENYYFEHAGESILFAWVEKIRDFIANPSESCNKEEKDAVDELVEDFEGLTQNSLNSDPVVFDEVPSIEHGEPLTDRKSVFQAHVAPVVCVEQVKQVLSKLKENRKIAVATHNIYAYRILNNSNGRFYQDCEDDGENKAGSLLLHLLQILDAQNVMVVVSRWYGGIHLGSDRFKHINNVARILLEQTGHIKQKPDHSKPKKKK